MDFIELKENDRTYRVFSYRGQLFRRLRNDSTGNYGIYEQYLPRDKTQQLKQIYGANGDVANVSSSLLLRFPSAKKHNVKNVLRDQVLAALKAYDNTSVLSTFEVDTSQHYDDGVYIYLNVSWAGNDSDAETKSGMLLNNIDAIIAIMSSTLPQPFDSVVLSTSLIPVTMKCFVLPTILSITTTYIEDAHNTDVEVKTVGLYDHIGIKINKENDNGFRRLRNQQMTTPAEYYDMSNSGGYDNILNIVGVDPTEDTFIATLFDNDYRKLYTSIQTPTTYIQQTQGTNGDLLNETIDGSITLDMNYNDFTAETQNDFIDTMNSETGGDTTIMNTTEGSAIVEYRVIFDVSKTQQEIDDVVTKLNDDVEIQNIINKSNNMKNVPAWKTRTKSITRGQKLTKQAKIINVIYDEANSNIVFRTIGSYKHILYKATERETFESSTGKVVDLPTGFTNKLDVKLVDVNDGDLTSIKSYSFDTISPVITLNGDTEIILDVGNSYIEQGATVIDNSGENITPVITGTVDTSTIGAYTITYTATDSSGNLASKNRIVRVTLSNLYVHVGGPVNQGSLWSLTDKNYGMPWANPDDPEYDPRSVDYARGLSIAFTSKTNNRLVPFTFREPNQGLALYWHQFGVGMKDTSGINRENFTGDPGIFTGGPFTFLFTITRTTSNNGDARLYKDGNLVGTIGNIIFDPSNVARDYITFPHWESNRSTSTTMTNIRIWNYVVDPIIVFDTTPPVITLIGDAEITLNVGDVYVEQGVTVTDNLGENIAPVITGSVDTNTAGTYTLTYTAKDSNNNTSTVGRIIQVIATTIVTRTFAGITSANAPNNYINLLNNIEALGFAENSLNNIYMDKIGYKLSVACKFKATAFNPAWNTVYSIHGPGINQLLLGNNKSGEMRLYIYNTAGNTNELVINVTLNVDYYTLFTYDHSAQSYTFQWNTSYSETGITTITQNSKNLEIGTGSNKWLFGESYWNDQEWIGPINDITISNKILSWAEAWPPIPNVIRTFVGSSSFGEYPNYLNLADNTEGLTFPEDNLTTTNYFQGNDHKFTYACRFNGNTWRNWGRLLDLNNGMNTDEILIKTNDNGSVEVFSYSQNYWANSNVSLSTGVDYYLLFTYDSAATTFTLVISENSNGTSPIVNFTRNDTPFTEGTRAHWGIGMSRYGIDNTSWRGEYFDGSIIDIAISNSRLTWSEAFQQI